MEKKLFLYHTNDLHSHFEQWPKIVHFMKRARELHREKGETVLLFDIGDHVDRSHRISEASHGRYHVSLMNELGYDFVTIGNNEGITLPKDKLEELYHDAQFQVLVANLFTEDGARPDWLKAYEIIDVDNGFRVGLIGVTAPYHHFYKLLGWDIRDPMPILESLVARVRQEVDLVVLLSHLGFHEDQRIAVEIKGIDLILGAHTHHLLREGVQINGTMIGQAGKFGHFVGQMVVTIDSDTKKVIRTESYAVPIDDTAKDEAAEERLQILQQESQKLLDEPIAVIHQNLSHDWFGESEFATLLADALLEWCDGEISMVNAGVLLAPLETGVVTKGDLHRICPHPINPCRVSIRGDKLKEVILQAVTDDMEQLEIRGLGFRGKVMGKMAFSGVDVVRKTFPDGTKRVVGMTIRGEELDPDRDYRLATVDMFTFGPLFPEISHAKEKTYFLPEMLRDILEWKLQQIE